MLANTLISLGRVRLSQGQAGDAIGHLERALVLRVDHESEPARLAKTRFVLARALWDAPANAGRERARELAELARAAHVEANDEPADEFAELETWLAAHGG